MWKDSGISKVRIGLFSFVVLVVSIIVTLKLNKDTVHVLMVDAGSTGSRLHVFKFEHQGSAFPELIYGSFYQTIPGLSSYADNPEFAAESLDDLFDAALNEIPQKDHSKTPIAVKATAGLRLLGADKSNVILNAVRERIGRNYPFLMQGNSSVEIMDGKDEGVYAWLTINYLLGRIGQNQNQAKTAAVFDLGGASTQIVFEPDFSVYSDTEAKNLLVHGDHRYDFKFGHHHHVLYQHSYLGYGLMEARKHIHQKILETNSTKNNPCISSGSEKVVTIGNKQFTMVGPSPTESQADHCIEVAKSILNLEKGCTQEPCAFNGVHQPSLTDTFSNEDVYIVSYFYDRVFQLGLNETFPLLDLKRLTETVCMGMSTWRNHFDAEIRDQLSDRPEWCLDLSFMFAILHYGYGLPLQRNLTVAKHIHGYQLSWALGASLQMLRQPAQFPEIYPQP
jgi:guanosine-diphosphatase